MIQLTRLNGQPLILNSDLIKLIESAPDTVITLVNGEKIVVKENCELVLDRIVEFRRRVLDGLQMDLCGLLLKKGGDPELSKQKAPPTGEL